MRSRALNSSVKTTSRSNNTDSAIGGDLWREDRGERRFADTESEQIPGNAFAATGISEGLQEWEALVGFFQSLVRKSAHQPVTTRIR
eukprot:scaffold1741_cov262-Pinguiococcus_pyrenoidosus.AAC.47